MVAIVLFCLWHCRLLFYFITFSPLHCKRSVVFGPIHLDVVVAHSFYVVSFEGEYEVHRNLSFNVQTHSQKM